MKIIMKAPSKFGKFSEDERGLVGIGTLIIFIALILVAAVAAGVIIRTSGALRDQARKTGQEAIQEVSNGVRVITAKGEVAGGDNIDNLEVVVSLRAGSSGINWKTTVIQYMSETTGAERHLSLDNDDGTGSDMVYTSRDELKNDWNALDNDAFAVVEIEDGDSADASILGTTGGKAEIWMNTKLIEDNFGDGGALQEGDEAQITIMPNVGVETVYTLIVPPSLDDKNIAEL